MNNIDIIIPSAKIVPEDLQNIGKLPAIIYPINQKIVFEYLYDQYKDKSDKIRVICYEKADKVHRILRKYESNKLIIEDLPVLDDLGHTISFALNGQEQPVVINFGDTIVFDNIIDCGSDCFFYTEDFVSDTWTFFEMKDGVLTEVYDKFPTSDNGKKKLFVGVFRIDKPQEFSRCLDIAFATKERGMSTFYYALQLYSKVYPLRSVKTDNWFDIGHADTYYNSRLGVRAREFNYISIDKQRGMLRKSSDDIDKFIGEIKWYLKLPSDIEYVSPRIFSYSTNYSDPYVVMEYYAYHTVHELFLYGDLKYNQWIDIFNRIRFVCNDFKRYTVKDDGIKVSLEDMYLQKTIQRFEKMKEDKRFTSFFESSIKVNGVEYLSLDEIIDKLKIYIPQMLFDVDEFNIIHGDLCFTNIMIDEKLTFIKVIDPRGKFGIYDIYGDQRYELAKLMHSVDGKYDFIIKDQFIANFDLEKEQIEYSILDRKREYDLYDIFVNVFADEIGMNLHKIELIEALLFLSMIPLHGESLNHQIVMLGTGLDILNRVINIRL